MAEREIVTTGAELAAAPAPIAALDSDPLAGLPSPALVETLDFETALTAWLARYGDLCEAAGLERPDVLSLESTPERILFEEAVYRETLLRSRINAVYRAGLLYFATGADLDHAAEISGVTRLEDENDADLRARVRTKNRGSSAAGPLDWWRAHAQAADAEVEDVAVTRPDFPTPAPGQTRGAITISVLAKGATGEPSTQTLAAVEAALTSPAVRGATTDVTVQAATRTSVDVTAEIWLGAGVDVAIYDGLAERLAGAWAAERALGWSVRESWLHAALTAPGVARVELVGWSDVVMAPDEAPLLGTITLTLKDGAQ